MWKTKTQISLYLHAVRQGPFLFANIFYSIQWVCKQMRSDRCTGFPMPSVFISVPKNPFPMCVCVFFFFIINLRFEGNEYTFRGGNYQICVCHPSEKASAIKGKNLLGGGGGGGGGANSFILEEGLDVQESKQEVTKLSSLYKWWQVYQLYPVPWCYSQDCQQHGRLSTNLLI